MRGEMVGEFAGAPEQHEVFKVAEQAYQACDDERVQCIRQPHGRAFRRDGGAEAGQAGFQRGGMI